jgi:anti-sigma factor RsiW
MLDNRVHAACRYTRRLNAFWDQELSQQEYQKIQVHLATCKLCQAQLEELRSLSTQLQTYDVPQTDMATEQFWKRLAPRLQARRADSDSYAWHPWTLLAPIGLAVSNAAFRTVALLASVIPLLEQWHLLPTSMPADVASLTRALIGPWLWDAGVRMAAGMQIPAALTAPRVGELWIVALWAAALSLPLLLSATYLGWLAHWVGSNDRINGHPEASRYMSGRVV